MKKILSILIIIGLLFNLKAQEALTLEQAFDIALVNNYDIKTIKNYTQISENNVNPALAGLTPRIDLSGSANYSNSSLQTENGEVNNKATYTTAGISLSYTLFDGLNNVYSFKKLKEQGSYAKLQERMVIENTLFQVSSSFYTVSNAWEQLQVNKERLDISAERYNRAKANHEFGNTSRLALLNAQVDLNNDSVNYANSLKDFDESKRNLNMLLGREPSINFTPLPPEAVFQEFQVDELKTIAFEHNSSYLMKENEITQSNYDVKIANSGFYPKLSLNSSYGLNQTAQNVNIQLNDPNRDWTTGITLSIPIFDGGIRRVNKNNAKISLENSEIDAELQKLSLTKEIENALAAYNNNIYVYQTESSNLASAELNFEQSKEAFKLGNITSTEFREAQLNLSVSKSNISRAKYSAKLYEVEILRLSGQLIE